ncbi:MAG TPA: type II toxin-antitoxin system HicB family antitoxin [Chloroflexota bacterium]|nr:type II toxin-antitoxin system HicB family antitoxin [Chloroflexota bacterium]
MIMTRSFTVVIERDPESGWLVGEVVELPGCYTQAPDQPTLETNVREAITAYLKTSEPAESGCDVLA